MEPKYQTKYFASPDNLQLNPLHNGRFLLLGTCQLGIIAGHAEKVGKKVDHILVSASIDMPNKLPKDFNEYYAQIISITLRDILREQPWEMRSGFRRLKCQTEDDFYQFYLECVDRLHIQLRRLMQFNILYGMTSLVLNFQTPQRNPLGFITPHYRYSNPIYFFDKLNEELEKAVLSYHDAYIINVDRLHAIFGKRFYQDDTTSIFSHNSIIDEFNYDKDQERLVKPILLYQYYGVEPHIFGDIVWREIDSIMRIISRQDAVKLVILDLDDTLWRGVAADDDLTVYERTEGWPISMIETLMYLRARGIMLGLCSKNDINFVTAKIEEVYGGLLELSDFQSVKCNWERKVENVAEILRDVNVLPSSAVFVDDNPTEVESVLVGFPEIRTLGFNHYDWKRILLWSPEMQVPYITDESKSRAVYSNDKMLLTPASGKVLNSFLLSADFGIGIDSKNYKRFFELLNKTNQFNTTGRRWTHSDIVNFLSEGGEIDVFFAKNNIYDAGLIAATLVLKGVVVQFVLSCRVFGQGIEDKILSSLITRKKSLDVTVKNTGRNAVALAFSKRYGFESDSLFFHISSESFRSSDGGEITLLEK